jgi:hypothetical protein
MIKISYCKVFKILLKPKITKMKNTKKLLINEDEEKNIIELHTILR